MMLGETIKDLRKQNSMSQEQLAEKLGVSRQSVSLWEKDSTQPTIDNIIALSDIFSVSVDSLLKSNAVCSDYAVYDKQPERKEKTPFFTKKQILVAVIDILILAIGINLTFFYRSATDDFTNVLDMHFNSSTMWFTVRCTVYSGILTALWLTILLLAFFKKKVYKIIKTVLIVLMAVVFVLINIQVARADEARMSNAVDVAPDSISYLDLKAFTNIDTAYNYSEEYSQGQTDKDIPINYNYSQDYLEYSTVTKCVEFKDKSNYGYEKNSYFNELISLQDQKVRFISDDECEALGIKKCAYYINSEDKMLIMIIDKGDRIYDCSITPCNEINAKVLQQIKALK